MYKTCLSCLVSLYSSWWNCLFLIAPPNAVKLPSDFLALSRLPPSCSYVPLCVTLLLSRDPETAGAAEGRGSPTALRVGLVTLRGVRAGEGLFAPYVALGQPVEDRRRELSSRFFPDRADAAATAVAAARGTEAMASGPSSSSSSPPQQQLLCSCPRCLFETEGDHRSCGREMLKV